MHTYPDFFENYYCVCKVASFSWRLSSCLSFTQANETNGNVSHYVPCAAPVCVSVYTLANMGDDDDTLQHVEICSKARQTYTSHTHIYTHSL